MRELLSVFAVVCLCLPIVFAGAASPSDISVECGEEDLRIGDIIEITVRSDNDQMEGLTGTVEMENLSFQGVSSAMATENAFILLPVAGSSEITYTCLVQGDPVSFACRRMTRTEGETSVPVADAVWTGRTRKRMPSCEPSASPVFSADRPDAEEGTPSATAVPYASSEPVPAPTSNFASPAGCRFVRAKGAARIEGTNLLGIPPESIIGSGCLENWLDMPEKTRCQVYSESGAAAAPQSMLSTGQTARVRTSDGKLVSRLTIVVSGDVLGSGSMNVSQLVRLARAINGSEPLEGPYLLAADMSGNGISDIGDLTRMAKELSGKRSSSSAV